MQHLARLAGRACVVYNFSDQSEATDLLGGLRPVRTQEAQKRAFICPLGDRMEPPSGALFCRKGNRGKEKEVLHCIVSDGYLFLRLSSLVFFFLLNNTLVRARIDQ